MRNTLILGALASLTAAACAFLYACSSNNSTPAPTPAVDAGDCTITAGNIPPGSCASLTCSGTTTCAIDETKCGPKATCLPMADNAGKQVLDFRIRRLNVVAPPALAATFVQNAIVTKNIDLKGICGDTGNGAFNWLIRINKGDNSFATGGAPPIDDPYGAYCFFKHDVAGLFVGPTTGTFKTVGTTLETNPVDKINIPIFINGDPNNVVILPISYGTIKDITVSPDQNCIGGFQPGAVDNTCSDIDESSCTRWVTAGALGGYITLEEADSVDVSDLSESLCVLLTQSSKDPNTGKCQRGPGGKITFQGDYCSTTKSPGGCRDAYWMAATFAAAAVKIDNAPTLPACTGAQGDGGTEDAGGDASPPVDAAGVDAADAAAPDAADASGE